MRLRQGEQANPGISSPALEKSFNDHDFPDVRPSLGFRFERPHKKCPDPWKIQSDIAQMVDTDFPTRDLSTSPFDYGDGT
jgi:hypothetical protein